MSEDTKRVGVFDIECSNLNADYGVMLCIAVKEDGVDTPHTIRIDDSPGYKKHMWDDSWLCKKTVDLLSGFDTLFGWNSTRFDIPFLVTRCVANGLPVPTIRPHGAVKHKDLIYASRYRLKLSSNRLEAVQDFLGLTTAKTRISPLYWVKALCGDRTSMDYIVDHCVKDVIVTAEVRDKILMLSPEIK